MSADALRQKLHHQGIEQIKEYPHIADAYRAALAGASENDRIIVFGSFHTVAEVMGLLQQG